MAAFKALIHIFWDFEWSYQATISKLAGNVCSHFTARQFQLREVGLKCFIILTESAFFSAALYGHNYDV